MTSGERKLRKKSRDKSTNKRAIKPGMNQKRIVNTASFFDSFIFCGQNALGKSETSKKVGQIIQFTHNSSNGRGQKK